MATRRIIAESDGHRWTDDWADIDILKGRVICVRCGRFRREINKPCPGDVKVAPRVE
jgi:hypothetical protein